MSGNTTENNTTDWYTRKQDSMSDTGGGVSIGVIAGVGIGACALIVGVIAAVIYCYMKARKKQSNTNMTKSSDVFSTSQSGSYPQRSRVNQYPDPAAARKAREREKAAARDKGHVNNAYVRHSSDSSSINSDVEGRDFSPPRVHRPRGGVTNRAYSSDSSYDDSSSVDEDPVVGGNYRMERETGDKHTRSSYKIARQNDLLDGGRSRENGEFRRHTEEPRRRSRRDEFSKRNPRSDSPLTIETLKKHEDITREEGDSKWDSVSSRKNKSRQRALDRESSPSRTVDSSEVTGTSLVTEATGTTASSRFTKNPSLRRNSPSRSSSHRRYRKDNEKDSHGRRKPRRTRSSERDRSRSPGSTSSRSGSGSTRRTRSSSRSEAKQINKEQAILPIFADTKKKKSSMV